MITDALLWVARQYDVAVHHSQSWFIQVQSVAVEFKFEELTDVSSLFADAHRLFFLKAILNGRLKQ